MPAYAYLTIDDSPSERTGDLCNFLHDEGIPAILYCRGDQIEKHRDAVARAIRQGFTMGNHTYSHPRASDMSVEVEIEEIQRAETLIDQAYREAGVERAVKTFRFPHMDRGAGNANPYDFSRFSPENREQARQALLGGLYCPESAPASAEGLRKQAALQDYLQAAGYIMPFTDVTVPWFQETEVQQSKDCPITFSTCDWMLADRQLMNGHPYQTVAELERYISEDAQLNTDGNVSIVLAHDQCDARGDLVEKTIQLIKRMKRNGIKFLDIPHE